ncbi:hypothetical protein HMPREF1550_00278 [Actinomyces sp. oral taxon 877 str. F0543]|nr:hypothetical protein HMPREF1550_00278 [Actinomyces sp. oral taxon 877 str. F0543]
MPVVLDGAPSARGRGPGIPDASLCGSGGMVPMVALGVSVRGFLLRGSSAPVGSSAWPRGIRPGPPSEGGGMILQLSTGRSALMDCPQARMSSALRPQATMAML